MTVIASLSISLDGFYTGVDASPEFPMGRGGKRLHEWFAHDVADRAQLTADEILAPEFERTGALIMGRDSYDDAEALWGEHPPFEMPIFVMTSRLREDDVRKGTTFRCVDSLDDALERAVPAANGKAVGLHGAAQSDKRCDRERCTSSSCTSFRCSSAGDAAYSQTSVTSSSQWTSFGWLRGRR